MTTCPRCSFENAGGVQVCAQCRAWLGWRDSSTSPGQTPPPLPGTDDPRTAAAPGRRRHRVVLPPSVTTPDGPLAAPPAAAPAPRPGATPAGTGDAPVPGSGGPAPVTPTASPPVDESRQPRTRPVAHRAPDGPPARLHTPERPALVQRGGATGRGAGGGEPAGPAAGVLARRPGEDTEEVATVTSLAGADATGAADPEASGRTLHCTACGRVWSADRYFCRCGRDLPRPRSQATVDARGYRGSWLHRVRGWFGRDGFWHRMRSANNGARVKLDHAGSLKDRAMRWGAALGAAGVGLSAIGPWGEGVRAAAMERVDGIIPSQFATAATASARSDTTADPEVYWAAAHAADQDLLSAWAAPWQPLPGQDTGEGDGAETCGRSDGVATVTVALEAPVDVARVVLHAGLAEDSPQRLRQARPRTVAVWLDDRRCAQAELEDAADGQVVDIAGRDVSAVRVEVVDVWQVENPGDGDTVVAVGEVLVQTRG